MKHLLILFLFGIQPLFANLDNAWQALIENRYEEARSLFKSSFDEDPIAQIGWFLTFTGNGPNDMLRDAALEVFENYPDSGAAEFVLKWMEPWRECVDNWVPLAGAIMENRRVSNPELKSLFANNLRMLARYKSETPEFSRISADAGFITSWLISRHYGSFPIPDFERSWPPEKADYWDQAVSLESRTGVIVPPREALGPGVLYAYSRFQNPAEQTLLFRIFSYQNIAVYIDGNRLGTFENLEEISPNIRHLSVELKPGPHEIIVKTTQTQNNNGQFSLQVTAAEQPRFIEPGLPKYGLTGSELDAAALRIGLAAEIAEREHELASFIEAILALRAKDDQTALAIGERLYEAYPGSEMIGDFLSQVYLDYTRFLPQDQKIGTAFQILSKHAAERKGHYLDIMVRLALLLNSANQTKPALELLKEVLDANPGYCDALEARLFLASQDSLLDIRQQTLTLLEDMGENHRWAQKKLLSEAKKEGNLALTRDLLENLSDRLPWEGYVAEVHNIDQDYRAAIGDLTKRWEIYSNRDYYPYAIAESYAKLGDLERQKEWLEKTLAINPAHQDALLDIVNLDCFEGRTAEAKERLQDYLRLEPGNGYLRQRLSHLQGATAFEDYRIDTARVIEDAKNKPISEGADSELLLDQLMVRLFPDGSQMRYTHLVTRVLTKDGVDNESELNLPRDLEILELRTIKANGDVLYPENISNKSTISLSGLGIGDFIDEEHIEYLPPASYDKDGLDASMTFIFQGIDRIYHHSELVLIYPADLEPEPVLLSRNMPVEPEIQTRDGLRFVRWLTQAMPPLTIETAMPPAGYFQPTASFYYNTSWDEIRDFYLNAVRMRLGLSDRLKDQADAWRKQHHDDASLARAVYEEVVDRIEPNPQFYKNVNLVWETRSGNATLLLAALYKYLGLDCDVVLVHPEEIRHYIFDTPMPSFSHVLLRLETDSTTHWIDANNKGLPFGYIPYPFRKAEGIVLNTVKEKQVQVPAFDDSTERVETEYIMDIADTGAVNAQGLERFFGLSAAQLTESFKAMNRPETKQQVEAGINQTFPGAAVLEVNVSESLPRGEFELGNTFRHPNLAQKAGDRLELPFLLPHVPFLERYGTMANRKTPVHISAPYYNIGKLELNLSPEYRWLTEPMTREIESRFGSYVIEIRREGNRKLTVSRTYKVGTQFVQPSDYEEFLEFCRAMVENEDLNFVAVRDTKQP